MSNKWLVETKQTKKNKITEILTFWVDVLRPGSVVMSEIFGQVEEEGVMVYDLEINPHGVLMVYAEGDELKTDEEFAAAELVEISIYCNSHGLACRGTKNAYLNYLNNKYLNNKTEPWNFDEWWKEFCSIAKEHKLCRTGWKFWKKYYDAGYSPACALSSFLGE